MSARLRVTIVIPTYRRERVLVESLEHLLALPDRAEEILVVDQTEQHESATSEYLEALDVGGSIRWIRQQPPSITAAMNRGLLDATGDIVLFLDDDITPEPELVLTHRCAHLAQAGVLVAGRVIQPWEEGIDFTDINTFRFACLRPQWITEFMGGNFSVRRVQALSVGGFDENFVRVAYRFEAEFAHRFRASGGRIRFEPEACLHHLRVVAGGTRSYGKHLTTWRPDHAVGAYYFALRTMNHGRWLWSFLSRLLSAVATRHHLRRPWWIPVTVVAELRGMLWGWRLFLTGPKLMRSRDHVS